MIRPITLVFVPLLLGVAVLVGGCTAPQESREVPQIAEKPAYTETAPVAEEIQAMRPEVKREVLAEGFPVEVPVPQGEVVRAQAQGTDAWDYEVRVAASPEALFDWFASAYEGRNWTIVGQGPLTGDGGGSYLEARKNAAESRVEVVNDLAGGSTLARVTVGLGTPVLGTY